MKVMQHSDYRLDNMKTDEFAIAFYEIPHIQIIWIKWKNKGNYRMLWIGTPHLRGVGYHQLRVALTSLIGPFVR